MIRFFTRRELTAIWSAVVALVAAGWLASFYLIGKVGLWGFGGLCSFALMAGVQLWRIAARPLRGGGDR